MCIIVKILIETYYEHFEYHNQTQLGIEEIRHTTKNNVKHNKINWHNNTILSVKSQHNDKFLIMSFVIFKTKVPPPYVRVDC